MIHKNLYLNILVGTIILFSLSFVSGADWDNAIEYKDGDLTVEVINRDAFGIGDLLGLDELLGTLTLKSHKSPDEVLQVEVGKDKPVMIYEFDGWKDIYVNGLGEVEFTDMRTGLKIQKDYHFGIVTYRDHTYYEFDESCKVEIVNKTSKEVCREVKTPKIQKVIDKITKLDKRDIPNEKVSIALVTDVNPKDYIDGVWEVAGQKIDRHSTWRDAGTDLDKGLFSFFTLNESSGETAYDTISGTNRGKEFADSNWVAGLQGNAHQANSTAKNLTWTTDDAGLDTTGEFSISLWFKRPNTADNNLWLFGLSEASSPGYLNAQFNSDFIRIAYNDNGGEEAVQASFVCATNTWIHYVAVANGTDLRFYINNSLVGTNTMDQVPIGVPYNFLLFGREEGKSPATNTIMDEFMFYNRSLSDSEIAQIYNNGTGIARVPANNAPEITLNAPANLTNSTVFLVSLNWTATDDTQVDNTTLYFNGVANQTFTHGTSNYTNEQITINFSEGKYNWTVSATDDEGSVTFAPYRLLYISSPAPVITLNSPPDTHSSVNSSQIFNCSATAINDIVNVSLYIDGIVNYTQTNSGDNFSSLEYQVDGLSYGTHNWTCRAYDNQDKTSIALVRTLQISPFETISEVHTAETVVGADERFEFNISMLSSLQLLEAKLFYNGTAYNGAFLSLGGGNYTISKSLTIPTTENQVNYTFYWQISIEGGIKANSTTYNQTVNPFLMDDCSSYNQKLLNFTMYDEETLDQVNGTINFNVNVYSYNTTSIIRSYNKSFAHTIGTESAVCVDNITLDQDISYEIQYYVNDSYFKKYKNIQKMTITDATPMQNISLYNLLSSSGQVFEVIVIGNLLSTNGNANLLVDTQRKYISRNEFLSVESSITSSDGKAITHLVESDEVYNFLIGYNGVAIGTFNNYRVKCQNQATGQCSVTLNLAQATGTATDFENYGNITQIFLLDSDTNTLSHTFSSTDGNTHTVRSLVIRDDAFGNTTICNNSLSGTSGTIDCIIPTIYQNTTFFVQTFVDGDYVGSKHFSQGQSPDWQGADIFIMLLMFSSLVLLMVGHPITIIIGAILGFVSPLILISIAGASFSTYFGAGLFYVVGGIISIWQISKRI